MTEYKTEDGRLFASAKSAALYHATNVGETLRFLGGIADAIHDCDVQLSPETEEGLGNFAEQVLGNEVIPDMRECLRAWEAYQSE